MIKPMSMQRFTLYAAGVLVATAALAACNSETTPQQNQEIRQQSAEATREVKKGARELAGETKVAAANAVQGINAVAAGVKQGSASSGTETTADTVNINTASTARLASLPGISVTKAHEIVSGRPYASAHALVGRGVLTQDQYDRIADKITAN